MENNINSFSNSCDNTHLHNNSNNSRSFHVERNEFQFHWSHTISIKEYLPHSVTSTLKSGASCDSLSTLQYYYTQTAFSFFYVFNLYDFTINKYAITQLTSDAEFINKTPTNYKLKFQFSFGIKSVNNISYQLKLTDER